MTPKKILTAIALLAAPAAANAATIVSFTPQAADVNVWPSSPTYTELGGNPLANGNTGYGLSGSRQGAQTMTITESGTLSHFAFAVSSSLAAGASSNTITFEVFRATAVDDLTPIGGIVDTFAVTASTAGWGSGGAGTYLIDINDAAVTAGQIWAVKASVTATGTALFTWDGGNPAYAGGQFDSFGQFNPNDVAVALYAAVPEPTSMALLGLGIVGLVARRR